MNAVTRKIHGCEATEWHLPGEDVFCWKCREEAMQKQLQAFAEKAEEAKLHNKALAQALYGLKQAVIGVLDQHDHTSVIPDCGACAILAGEIRKAERMLR
jgi:hypothetical protein